MYAKQLGKICVNFSSRIIPLRVCSSSPPNEESGDSKTTSTKPGGFHQAFLKYTQLDQDPIIKDDVSFSTLMRHSKLIDLGDPSGKIVTGRIFHIVNDDLYIDFGGKFHCVCSRPSKTGHLYVRGSIVKLRLKELELSTKFLGSEKDLSLLEADADLIGIVSTPRKSRANVT